MRRNPSLPVGLGMLLVLAIFLIVGRFFVDLEESRAVSVAPLQSPSRELPVRQRPPGPQHVRRSDRRHAA